MKVLLLLSQADSLTSQPRPGSRSILLRTRRLFEDTRGLRRLAGNWSVRFLHGSAVSKLKPSRRSQKCQLCSEKHGTKGPHSPYC